MKKIILLAGAMVSAAAAGAAPATNAADEIVVTASRAGRAAAEMPQNVSIITARDIEKSGAANVVEAMKNVGGVEFRSTSGNSAQAEIALRGFGENSFGRVLVLLDGQRLNRPDMAGINWLQIPLANVERIEILRGGQSALYGDNATAGVINIVTHKGTAEPVTAAGVDVASWGTLIAEGVGQINPIRIYWWLIAFPGGVLVTTLLALNFLGDGLRDAWDVKSRN